jgi:prepilin-type N-terminal cleavage/methylation domain-containing protein
MKNKRAFTLIELLVVMTVIAILASVVFVSLGSARDKANEAKIKVEASQMKRYIEMQELTSTPAEMATMVDDLSEQHDYIENSKYSITNNSFCFDYLINSVSWCTDSTTILQDSSCDTTPGENEGKCVAFIEQHTLTISITGNGSVTLNGVSCDESGTHSYSEGTTVDIVAVPDSGYELTEWGGGVCSGSGLCSVEMDGDRTVTALFAEEEIAEDCSTIGGVCGGGIVADIDNGDIIIAASDDNSAGIEWGCYGTTTEAISDTDGSSNTSIILGVCSETPIAASVCYSYEGGDYTDWYLPARTELSTLYTNRVAIGEFADDYYWSSTEDDSDRALGMFFGFGGEVYGTKADGYRVRCVRRH